MEGRVVVRRMLLACVALVIAGCGNYKPFRNTFEGRGDYRSGLANAGHGEKLEDARMFFTAKEVQERNRMFKRGDYVSIHLKRAYLGWFSEGLEEVAANWLFSSPTKGEIAIVANVTDGALEVQIEPTSGSAPGKVIFYSGDVYPKQTLNLSMVPVYGPVAWSGNPIQMDFTLIELDGEERKALDGLLGALASLGTNPALKQAPLVGATLKNLGSAFVQANQDDIIGRYRLSFMPSPSSNVSLPVLQEGDFVLVTSAKRRDPDNERAHPFRWDCFDYDHAEGLLKPKELSGCNTYLTDYQVRYFVFSVLKNQGERDQSPQATLAEVYQQLLSRETSAERAGRVFNELLAQRTVWMQSREQLARLRASKADSVARITAAEFLADVVQCSTYRQLVDRKSAPWASFAADAAAVCARGGVSEYLDSDQLDWLTTELSGERYGTNPSFSKDSIVGSDAATSQQKRGALSTALATRQEPEQ